MAANSQTAPVGAYPETLADRLDEGALPFSEALRYAISLAEALREVHRQERVYGLLEPAGVAIIEGEVRLLPSRPSALTPYFSPEQVAGNDLDWRSDIFSLGAVMYEMFSGRRAFRAATKTALRMEILNRDSAAVENLPPALALLIQRCLEKRPERRIQRMEILLAELKLQNTLLSSACPGRQEPDVAAMEPDQTLVIAGGRREGSDAAERAPARSGAAAPREKLNLVCPVCGARDVHASRQRGVLEAALGRLGMSIGRCYRCYYRFISVAGFSIKKPGLRI